MFGPREPNIAAKGRRSDRAYRPSRHALRPRPYLDPDAVGHPHPLAIAGGGKTPPMGAL